MAKTKISEFSSTPANNTDIDSINIAEGCAPSGINDAIRELMAQLKDWQAGTSNDPMVIGSSGSLTLNQGTANGVAYLNGSKVVTSGSALTFDGTNLGIGTSSPSQKLEVAGNMYINTSGNPYLQIKTSGSGNNPYIRMQADTNYWDIQSTFSNTNDDLLFQYNGTALLDLDKNGNLGLGVTPSAWNSGVFKAFEGNSYASCIAFQTGGPSMKMGTNWFYNNSGNYVYKTTAAVSRMDFNDGYFNWYIAPSGTAGNAISFTQAMTLDASGNLLVGCTSSIGNGRVSIQAVSGSKDCLSSNPSTNANYNFAVMYNNGGSGIGSISCTTTTTAYNTSSDYRLKNTIAPMTGALAKVAQLKPVTYKWNSDDSDGEGFIAHELAEVCPHAVTGEKDAVDAEGNPQYQGIDVSFLVVTLTAAIQEQQAIITQLQADVAALKA